MASLVTDIGNAKLLVASPLNPVTIKSIVVGSGTGPFDSSILSLKQQVWIGNASAPVKTPDGKLKFTTHIPSSVGGWTINEWGLIDTAGDLIAYGQLEEGIYKQMGTMSVEPYFYIQLSSSLQTDIIVTDSVNFDHAALTNRNHADAHNIASITGLEQRLSGIETDATNKDNQNVKITGDQIVDGVKTFSKDVVAGKVRSASGSASIQLSDANGGAGVAIINVGGKSVGFDSAANIVDFGTLQINGDGSGISEATLTKKGAIQLATSTEVIAGTQASKAVTPATLKAALGSTGTAPIFGARAWCNFNGASGAIRASGNIASVTRSAVGTYDVVFTTPMPDANYAVVSSTSSMGSAVSIGPEGNTQTTTGFRLNAWYGGDNSVGKFDPAYCAFTVFR